MASNLLQIKRSQTTATPTSLANGELAFTAAGNVVFIGNFGSVLPIAGERNPGILTANQALVANSTGYIDQVKTGNLYVSGINSNGTYGSTGQILLTNGTNTYWGSATDITVGSQYVVNTDSRTLSGNLNFTGANTYVSNLNVVTINRSPKLTLTGDVSGNATFTNLTDASLNVTITKDFVMDVYAGNGIVSFTGTGAGSAPTISVKPADGVKANTTGLYANVDNSTLELFGGAIQVKDDGIALGTKTTGDYVQSVNAGNGINVSVSSGEGSAPIVSVKVGSGLVSNTSGLFVDTGVGQTFDSITVNGQSTLNGNVVLGDAIQDKITLNGSLYGTIIPTVTNSFDVGSPGAIYTTGWFNNLRLGSASDSYISASGNTISVTNLTVNSDFIANTGTVYHDFYIGGDLHITGNAVYSNVESYIINDPLIQLGANNNLTDLIDIGFFGNYGVGGGHKHTGLFRDASDGVYKLFTGLDPQPTTYVDTANGTYTQATLQAYLNSGALVSNATNLSVTATSSLAVAIVANTLTLSTPLAATSGGTGYKTYAVGDILIADSSTTLTKLSIGPAGSMLQSNGTSLVYETLDGGTF